ncbi:MAG: hypothetical protein SFX72_21920 [Isosphaeraceae bacterium]|nr:hypothetical protein [Isosphaeraceae bacterium]
MSDGPQGTYRAKTAAEITELVALSDDAKSLLEPGATPRQFIDRLMEKALWIDAVKFMAFALPKREAIWWGLVCARQAYESQPPPEPAAKALEAADTWLLAPNDDNRRAAMAAAEVAGFGTPAGSAALAAFFSGGSLGPANVPAVPPPETLTPQAVAGAVMLSAVLEKPELAPKKHERFVTQGFDVAAGKSRWGGH